jgi:RimJ/RimL family protein N-acetyltransferase
MKLLEKILGASLEFLFTSRHNSDMATAITVTELSSDDWPRLRDLRLAALADSPAILAGKLDEERNFTEEQWRETFKKLSYVVASIDGKDVAMINVENLVGDFGATCWLGGLWSNPEYRGSGAVRAIFNYMGSVASKRGWMVQGLGVMESNTSAIAVFEKYGFTKRGDRVESRGKPGNYYFRMIKSL